MLSTCTKIKLDLLDFTYTYKEKSWTCWILPTCTIKKNAGLVVGYYLHVQRKKLDTYMQIEKSWTCWMLSVLQRKKLDLFR